MAEPMGGGAAAAKPDNKRALWSLILGIVGIICCNLAAPFAWYMGRNEVKAIDAGQGAKENRGMALAGMILGIIGTVLLVLGAIWFLFFGGMAVISSMSQGMQ
jgi:tetrahydromethanopterin S-methyltransferase subunit C